MERGLPTPPEASEFRPEKLNGEFKGKDIYSGDQFDLKSFNIISELIPQMEYIAKNAIDSRILGGTMTALLFYEASTRTKLSFDTGIKQLGGQTTTEYTQALSEAKGESFEGTIKNLASEMRLLGRSIVVIKQLPAMFSGSNAPVVASSVFRNFVDSLNEAGAKVIVCLDTDLGERMTPQQQDLFYGFTALEVKEPPKSVTMQILAMEAEKLEKYF